MGSLSLSFSLRPVPHKLAPYLRIGYNYAGLGIYAEDHRKWPNRTFVGTESFAQASHTMWSQVWNQSSVIGQCALIRIVCENVMC